MEGWGGEDYAFSDWQIATCWNLKDESNANARRIARTPDLKQAYLDVRKAADELAEAVDHEINLAVQDMGAQMAAAYRTAQALAAYRKAIGETE